MRFEIISPFAVTVCALGCASAHGQTYDGELGRDSAAGKGRNSCR